MKKRELFALWLSLPLVIVGAVAQAQTSEPAAPAAPAATARTTPYDVEIGFRTLKVTGNEQMYRSQLNERKGFLLRSLTLSSSDFEGKTSLFDQFRVDASDLGAGPAGALRLQASKAEVYRFTLGYRHANVYSALPAFANPLVSQGVIPGQHTWDRTRNMLDADLEFLPGRAVTPFIGYSFNNISGPGTTTYQQGGEEFLLSQQLEDRDHEYRVGAGFNVNNKVYGSITQGWRTLRSEETLGLIGPNTGNSTTPVLGRDPSATAITRSDRNEVKTPFTNVYATADVNKRLRLTGNYSSFAAETTGNENELLTGSFLSFGINRFFTGLTETAAQRAKNTTWRGGARAEVAVVTGLDAFVAYSQDHRELTGTALINTLYSGTTNFSGLDPKDITTALNAASGMTRKETATSVGASYRPVTPVSLRVEYRETKQDADVAPDLSEIVVPGNQGGVFERKIKTFDTNGSVSKWGLTVGAAYRRDSADNPIFRTDFESRNRTRLRASYAAPKWVRLGVTAENLRQSNPQVGIQMSGKVRQYSGDVEVAPVKQVAVRGSVSQFKADNSIQYRRPENFTTDLSVYVENGKAKEGGVLLSLAPVSFDAAMSKFENRGDNPFNIDRTRLRLGLDIPKTRAGIVAEYARDKYHELNLLFGDYTASRFGLFLRIHP